MFKEVDNEGASNKGLLVFLTVLVSIVVIAIVISSTTTDIDIDDGEGFSFGRIFLYIRYYILELIAFLFMQK